jgi:hypothetical protein
MNHTSKRVDTAKPASRSSRGLLKGVVAGTILTIAFLITHHAKRNGNAGASRGAAVDPSGDVDRRDVESKGAPIARAAADPRVACAPNGRPPLPTAEQVVPVPDELTGLQQLIADGSGEVPYEARTLRTDVQEMLDGRVDACWKDASPLDRLSVGTVDVAATLGVSEVREIALSEVSVTSTSGTLSAGIRDCVRRNLEELPSRVARLRAQGALPDGFSSRETYRLAVVFQRARARVR